MISLSGGKLTFGYFYQLGDNKRWSRPSKVSERSLLRWGLKLRSYAGFSNLSRQL